MFKFVSRLFKKDTFQPVSNDNVKNNVSPPKPARQMRTTTRNKTITTSRYVSPTPQPVNDDTSLLADIITTELILSSFDDTSYSSSDSCSSSSDSFGSCDSDW